MYHEIFHNIDAGFCVIDMVFDGEQAVDYVIRTTNGAFERYTGLSPNALNVSIRNLLPEHEQEWFDRYGHVARTGNRIHFEMQAKALKRWYSVDAFRVGQPEQARVAILFMDITERKRVERELAESEARFSALADGLPMPVWVLDAQGVVRFVNSAYGEFLAWIFPAVRCRRGANCCIRTTCRRSSSSWPHRCRNSAACARWCVRAAMMGSGAGSK